MKEIRIPLEEFDLEDFLDRTVDFVREWISSEVNPTYAMVWVQNLGDVPVFGPESGSDVLSALNELNSCETGVGGSRAGQSQADTLRFLRTRKTSCKQRAHALESASA
jgi:hypothetical protein